MAVQSSMPHELLGYDKDDVYGVMLSISIISEVSNKEHAELNKQSTKAKQNPRRARMMAKNPGYI